MLSDVNQQTLDQARENTDRLLGVKRPKGYYLISHEVEEEIRSLYKGLTENDQCNLGELVFHLLVADAAFQHPKSRDNRRFQNAIRGMVAEYLRSPSLHLPSTTARLLVSLLGADMGRLRRLAEEGPKVS